MAEEKGIPTDPLDIEKGRERNLEENSSWKDISKEKSLSAQLYKKNKEVKPYIEFLYKVSGVIK